MHCVLAFDSHFRTSPSPTVGGVSYLRASTYILPDEVHCQVSLWPANNWKEADGLVRTCEAISRFLCVNISLPASDTNRYLPYDNTRIQINQ